jgi:RHS repeat-associated protein
MFLKTTYDPLMQFTGKERDAETGLDYFGARYFSGAQGRFMTPDWSEAPTPVPYADFSDPQTLNLYAYVRNNPIATSDLDGHGFWKKLGNLISYGEWTDDEKELEKRLQEEADELRAIAQENDLSEMSETMATMSNKQVVNSRSSLTIALADKSFTREYLSRLGDEFLGSQMKIGEMPLGPSGFSKNVLKFARNVGINASSPGSKAVLGNLDMPVENFIGLFRQASVRSEMPKEFMKKTVREALKDGSSTVRKLLIDKRFAK